MFLSFHRFCIQFISSVKLLLLLSLGIWLVLVIPSQLAANLGWVYLTRAILDVPLSQPHLHKANEWFSYGLPSENGSANIGADIVAALQRGEVQPSINTGYVPIAAPRFITLAAYLERQSDLENAARLYFLAAELSPSKIENNVSLGQFCQRHRDVRNEYFPKTDQYCNEWLQRNSGNLLTNPYFEGEGVPGWRLIPTKRSITADLAVQAAPAQVDSTLTLKSDATLEESNSFCQRIVLTTKEVLEFSATIETQPEAENAMEARILYIGWRDSQGRSQGNQQVKIVDDRPKAVYRRQFTLPEEANPDVLFCPVDVSGQGSVSLSNVRVQSFGVEP